MDDVDQAEHAATYRTPSESIADAMAVSIYAVFSTHFSELFVRSPAFVQCADAAMQRTTHLNSPLFQPRTLSIILDLIRSILQTPRECGNLDADRQNTPGKATLLQWGNVTPWSWVKWTDSRIGMFETVITLVRRSLEQRGEVSYEGYRCRNGSCMPQIFRRSKASRTPTKVACSRCLRLFLRCALPSWLLAQILLRVWVLYTYVYLPLYSCTDS